MFKFFLVFVFCMFDSLFLLSNLELELSHAALQLEKLHVEGGLLTAERRHLLLQARVFSLLVRIVPFHLLLNFEILVSQGLTRLLCLHGQHALEGVLLGPEYLDLALVEVQLFGQLTNHVLSRYGETGDMIDRRWVMVIDVTMKNL